MGIRCSTKAELAAYVVQADTADEWSMHLALREKEESDWEILYFGIGVLYADADFDTEEYAGTTNVLTKVTLVRFQDGTFGVCGFDGEPLLYLTPEQYLKPEYRQVTAKVICLPE